MEMRHLEKEELFIGAWVNVPDTDKPSCVIAIDFNGKFYCQAIDGLTSMCNLEDLRGVPINAFSLENFGFALGRNNVWFMEFADVRLTASLREMRGGLPCRRVAVSGRYNCWNEEIRYVHELQRWWADKILLPYGMRLDLTWKEVE